MVPHRALGMDLLVSNKSGKRGRNEPFLVGSPHSKSCCQDFSLNVPWLSVMR